VNNDCIEVDELILEIAGLETTMPIWLPKNFSEVLDELGSLSVPARPRAGGWLPNSARQQLRQIIKRIQVQIHQSPGIWVGV